VEGRFCHVKELQEERGRLCSVRDGRKESDQTFETLHERCVKPQLYWRGCRWNLCLGRWEMETPVMMVTGSW